MGDWVGDSPLTRIARIVRTHAALSKLEPIGSYLREFYPAAAQRMARRPIEAGDSLLQFPDRRRPIAGARRELVTIPPNIIQYRFDGERVFIVGIRHGMLRPD